MRDYKINDTGIYYTSNSYHDDVDVNYVVDFRLEKAVQEIQLRTLLNTAYNLGKNARTTEIATLLGVIR